MQQLYPGYVDSEAPFTYAVISGDWQQETTPQDLHYNREPATFIPFPKQIWDELKDHFMMYAEEVKWQSRTLHRQHGLWVAGIVN